VVIGRPDVAAVVMVRARRTCSRRGSCWSASFAAAVRNARGMVLELPSGSSFDESLAPLQVAAEEVHEETGCGSTRRGCGRSGSRQVAATLLGHHARCTRSS
jgi:hypothetical protein